MQFHVPQFIELEDKIFGPLTVKQFVYLGGAGGFVLLLYSVSNMIATFLLGAPVVGLAVALAFYKINNRPFINVLESAFRFISHDRLYIWKKEPRKVTDKNGEDEEVDDVGLYVPKLSDSKLKDLAWSLDIQEKPEPNKQ